jgi:hypothetical protein
MHNRHHERDEVRQFYLQRVAYSERHATDRSVRSDPKKQKKLEGRRSYFWSSHPISIHAPALRYFWTMPSPACSPNFVSPRIRSDRSPSRRGLHNMHGSALPRGTAAGVTVTWKCPVIQFSFFKWRMLGFSYWLSCGHFQPNVILRRKDTYNKRKAKVHYAKDLYTQSIVN